MSYHFGKLKGWLFSGCNFFLMKTFDQWEISTSKLAIQGAVTFYFQLRLKKCFHKIYYFSKTFLDLKFFLEFGPLGPLKKPIFWIKHFREKLQKVNPHYFSILRGVCFLHFFRKTAPSASNSNFLQIFCEILKKMKTITFYEKMEVWGTWSRFSEKVKKADPP